MADHQLRRLLLLEEFIQVPLAFIDLQLKEHGNLFKAYQAIALAERTYDQVTVPPYKKLTKPRKSKSAPTDMVQVASGPGLVELRTELRAVRKRCEKEEGKLAAQTHQSHAWKRLLLF